MVNPFLKREHSSIMIIKTSLPYWETYVSCKFNFHRWGLHITRYSCILGPGPDTRTSSGAGVSGLEGLICGCGMGYDCGLLTCSPVNSPHSATWLIFLNVAPVRLAYPCLNISNSSPLSNRMKFEGQIPGLQSLPQSASQPYLPLAAHTNPLLTDHESTQVGTFKEALLIH